MKRYIEFLVGMLFLLGLFAFFILAFRITNPDSFYSSKSSVKVYVEFDNIGNLKARAKVAIGGVIIGRVTDIKLLSETFMARVEIAIEPEYFKLPEDSNFSILTVGLLGENYISVEPGFEEEFLQAGQVLGSEFSNSAVVLEELLSKFIT